MGSEGDSITRGLLVVRKKVENDFHWYLGGQVRGR